MATVLVTGGTGTLGRRLVPRLQNAGWDVRVVSRHPAGASIPDGVAAFGVDLRTGDGLEKAVAGTDAVVHAATHARHHRHVDVDGTRHLIEAVAIAAPHAHLVYPSIVGIEQIPLGYYRSKLGAEEMIGTSPHRWSVLRATQFHQFIGAILDRITRMPVTVVPRAVRFQPVDAGAVADRFVELLETGGTRRVENIGGPDVLPAVELARSYLRASGRRRPVIEGPAPGKALRGFAAGGNLTEQRATGTPTWFDYLAERFGS